MLKEACSFMSIGPQEFIAGNLRRVLPGLFVDAQAKVLHAIAQEVGEKVSILFLRHSHEILASVLRIQAPVQSAKAIQCIVSILREAAKDKQDSIDIAFIIRAYIVELLAELVVVLGDDNPDEVGAVSRLFVVVLMRTLTIT